MSPIGSSGGHREDCEGDWGPEGQESPCRCGEEESDPCPHDDWIVTERGEIYVTLCLDCGKRESSHNIEDWSIK